MSVKGEVQTIHNYWMSTLYPRQSETHPVMGKYRPEDKLKRLVYLIWALVGVPVTGAGYAVAVIGYFLSFFIKRASRKALQVGATGVFLSFAILWSITGISIWQLYGVSQAVAFGIASCVGLISILTAFITKIKGSTRHTVLISYPSSYTAVFLPPISAALVTPFLGGDILNASVMANEFVLDNIFSIISVDELLKETFELEGLNHIIVWVVFSTILGWKTGSAVKLAEAVIIDDEDDD